MHSSHQDQVRHTWFHTCAIYTAVPCPTTCKVCARVCAALGILIIIIQRIFESKERENHLPMRHQTRTIRFFAEGFLCLQLRLNTQMAKSQHRRSTKNRCKLYRAITLHLTLFCCIYFRQSIVRVFASGIQFLNKNSDYIKFISISPANATISSIFSSV